MTCHFNPHLRYCRIWTSLRSYSFWSKVSLALWSSNFHGSEPHFLHVLLRIEILHVRHTHTIYGDSQNAKCTHGSITKNPHSDSFACSSKTRTCRETICSIIQTKLQMWKVHMCFKEKKEKQLSTSFNHLNECLDSCEVALWISLHQPQGNPQIWLCGPHFHRCQSGGQHPNRDKAWRSTSLCKKMVHRVPPFHPSFEVHSAEKTEFSQAKSDHGSACIRWGDTGKSAQSCTVMACRYQSTRLEDSNL